MVDLLGFISIATVTVITLIIALKKPNISMVLFTALLVRIFFMLIGHSFLSLPDSTADARSFELTAWTWAQDGFFNHLNNYPGPSPRFVSWLIGVPYSLLGRSLLMAQSISLLFGIGCIVLGWELANKIWDRNSAKKITWAIALFPSLILYSILVMREVYIVFFVLVAFYGVCGFIKNYNLKSFFLAIFGFTGATFFHGAMLVGAIIFITYIGTVSFKIVIKSLINFKINLKILIVVIFSLTSILFYTSNKINVAYLGDFQNTLKFENLIKRTNVSTSGTARWPEWTRANTNVELIYKIPIRTLYFLFSPFPWDIKETKHLIGFIDGILYMYLFYLILRNIKFIWKDPSTRLILIILVTYITVFAVGVGNFGTSVRHRSKFTVLFILLAGPLFKNFHFSKKKIKKGN